jgi:hypothetical protein
MTTDTDVIPSHFGEQWRERGALLNAAGHGYYLSG